MTPVPVPVVNEVAEALSQGVADWTEGGGVFTEMAERALAAPSVAAAFEAQAKLEAAESLLRDAIRADFIPLDVRGAIARFVEEGGEGS